MNDYEKIPATDIITDSEHQFVTNMQLQTFRDKPSNLEIDRKIENLRTDLFIEINNKFNTLLNTPDAVEKIRNIIDLIKYNDNLDTLIEYLDCKVDNEELKDHIASNLHVSNNDRKAMNYFIDLMQKGVADWNAEAADPNYIKNKPSALPANGGDADTVDGYHADELFNRRPVSIIYGTTSTHYDRKDVDTLVNKLPDLNFISGKVIFRRGEYTALDFNTSYYKRPDDLIIIGEGDSTIFSAVNVMINDKTKIRDVKFKGCNITVGNYSSFDNVYFEDCTITFEESIRSSMSNCILKNSTVNFNNISGCFIKDNISYGNAIKAYIGGNNVFRDNITLEN